jgi:hypothetical protein
MGPSMPVRRFFHRIITTITSVRIAATVILDHIVATMTLDTTVEFFIPFVALLTSLPVVWRKEHHWNLIVLQRVHLSSLVGNCIESVISGTSRNRN